MIALFTLFAVACGEESEASRATQAEPMPSVVIGLYPNGGAAADAWAGSSPFQRDLLRDGELSYADYESAVMSFSQCVTARGIVFSQPPTYETDTRRFTYTIQLGRTEEATRDLQAQVDDCYSTYLRGIEGVWGWTNRTTGAELQEADLAWDACLAEWGMATDEIHAIPPWGTDPWLDWLNERMPQELMHPSEQLPAWLRCYHTVSLEYPLG